MQATLPEVPASGGIRLRFLRILKSAVTGLFERSNSAAIKSRKVHKAKHIGICRSLLKTGIIASLQSGHTLPESLPFAGLPRHAGSAHEDFVKGMKAEPFDAFTFKVAGAAIYHLGNFGTAAKKLWQYQPAVK